MLEHDFVVGDRVRRIHFVNPNNPDILPGMVGTICAVKGISAYVHWDKFPSDHEACRESNDFHRLEYLGSSFVSDLQRGCSTGSAPVTPVGKPTNPKDRAATHRLDLSLYPQSAIAYGALGMTEGDCKYAGYNYRESGVGVSTYVAAALRHIFKYYNGEWADPKTQVPHLASFLACGAILVDGHVQGNLTDDRPPKQNMDTVLTECEGIVKHLHEIFPNGPERVTEQNIKRQHGCVSDR